MSQLDELKNCFINQAVCLCVLVEHVVSNQIWRMSQWLFQPSEDGLVLLYHSYSLDPSPSNLLGTCLEQALIQYQRPPDSQLMMYSIFTRCQGGRQLPMRWTIMQCNWQYSSIMGLTHCITSEHGFPSRLHSNWLEAHKVKENVFEEIT